MYASAGQSSEQIGYLLEYQKSKSNGFKQLNNQANTGFDIKDFMGKIKLSTRQEAKIPLYLEFKYHYYDETSNETYLGITKKKFSVNPYDRYAISQGDQINADHQQFMLTHVIDFSEQLKIFTNAIIIHFQEIGINPMM